VITQSPHTLSLRPHHRSSGGRVPFFPCRLYTSMYVHPCLILNSAFLTPLSFGTSVLVHRSSGGFHTSMIFSVTCPGPHPLSSSISFCAPPYSL
jgi:hypothetical protein